MPKYKVKHTSIMHNKQVYAEGSEIELNTDQAKRLADFLTPVKETKTAGGGSADKPPKAETKTAKTAAKNKSKSKTAQKKSEPEKDPEEKGAEINDPDTDPQDGGAE